MSHDRRVPPPGASRDNGWRRVLRIFGAAPEDDVDTELGFHLAMRTDDYLRNGLAPSAARAAAEHRFGNVTGVREVCRRISVQQERRSRWIRLVTELGQDARWAARALRKRPGFTLIAAFTLALGIGANAAIFSVVNAYLLQPLPLPNASRLLAVAATSRGSDVAGNISYPNFLDLRARADVFQDAVLFDDNLMSVRSDSGEARREYFEAATGNYFRMLGVRTILGRGLTEQDDAQRLRYMVLTYSAWHDRFAGDRAIVGKSVRINGLPFTIIGVVAPGYDGLRQYLLPVDGMMPIRTALALEPNGDSVLQQRRGANFRVIALLKPGVAVGQARAALAVVGDRLSKAYPDDNPGFHFVAALETRSRPDIAVAGTMPWVAGVFMALVGLVLVIGCVNVASLVLARAAARRTELGVRRALGASDWRVSRQIVTETMLLAGLGLVGAIPIAYGALAWLTSLRVSTDAPVRVATALDWRMVMFSVFVTVVAGLVAGLGPAWRSAHEDLHGVLKEGGRTGNGGGRIRGRNALVVGQVAVSLVLLVCAGLFVRSVGAASHLDLGFRNSNILMLQTDLTMVRYTDARGRAFYRDLVERARALPGVHAVALNRDVPLGYDNRTADVFFDRDIGVPDNHIDVLYNVVTPDYFTVLGYPVLEGRAFGRGDDSVAPRVAVINSEMARRFWPGKSAVGQQVRLEKGGPAVTIVGVVKAGKYSMLNEPPRSFMYLPFDQHYHADMMLSVLARGDAAGLISPIRQVVHRLDPEVAPYEIKTMHAHLHDGLWFLMLRLAATLAAAIGMLGLLQTTIGVYGVQSLGVAQRSREIGIRVALGARPGQVVWSVLRRGITLSAVGVAIGVALALGLTRTLRALLIGVSDTDAFTFVLAIVILLAVSLLATALPARRAARLEPTLAMREDG
jgi:predicted permease